MRLSAAAESARANTSRRLDLGRASHGEKLPLLLVHVSFFYSTYQPPLFPAIFQLNQLSYNEKSGFRKPSDMSFQAFLCSCAGLCLMACLAYSCLLPKPVPKPLGFSDVVKMLAVRAVPDDAQLSRPVFHNGDPCVHIQIGKEARQPACETRMPEPIIQLQ